MLAFAFVQHKQRHDALSGHWLGGDTHSRHHCVCPACCLSSPPPPQLLPCLLQLDKASRGGVAGSKSSSVGSIGSMLPLLIVAVLAFLVGQYVSGGLPALQQLVSGGRDD